MSKRHFLFLLAACILFVFIFNPTHLYFLSDDWDSLLFSIQPLNILHSFRPLSDASLLLDYRLWQMNASGFHLTNYFLHFGCVFCVYHFAKQLLLRYNEDVISNLSLACSLLFLYYPFHSEAVFWIVGRGAILCTLFGLLSLLFFIQKEKKRFFFLLSVLCFAMALLSYEEAWILPVIITILAFVDSNRSNANKALQVSIFWMVFLSYLAGRFYFTQNVIGTPYGSERMMNFDVFFLIRNFAAFIFRSFILPLQSSVLFAGLSVGLGVILFALLFFYRKKIHSLLLISTVFFFISLIPVLPLGIDTHDTESERFLYFPSVFFILSVVQLFAVISEKRYKAVYALLLLGIIPLWLSFDSFKISSIVSKKTASAIQKISGIDTLFCQQLPGQYKGAFIFRNGFISMIHLLKTDSVQATTIVSTSELFHPNTNYNIELNTSHSKLLEGSFQSNNIYVRWQEDGIVLSRQPVKK